MRNLSFIFLLSIFVSSCASTYVTDQNISKPEKAYKNIFVISLFNKLKLKKLDEKTYNSSIKDHFYDLDNIKQHPVLQKCVEKKLASNRTIVVPTYKLYKINEEVSYVEFLAKMDEKGIDAILVINQKNYSYDKSERIKKGGEISVTESPNAVFNTYLIDRENLTPVWVSQIHSAGSEWDTHGSMYNSMGKKLSKKLIKSGYIRPPFHP